MPFHVSEKWILGINWQVHESYFRNRVLIFILSLQKFGNISTCK